MEDSQPLAVEDSSVPPAVIAHLKSASKMANNANILANPNSKQQLTLPDYFADFIQFVQNITPNISITQALTQIMDKLPSSNLRYFVWSITAGNFIAMSDNVEVTSSLTNRVQRQIKYRNKEAVFFYQKTSATQYLYWLTLSLEQDYLLLIYC